MVNSPMYDDTFRVVLYRKDSRYNAVTPRYIRICECDLSYAAQMMGVKKRFLASVLSELTRFETDYFAVIRGVHPSPPT